MIGASLAFGATASASPPLDLFEESGLRMDLPSATSLTAFGPDIGPTAVGDINGDGLKDLAVGHPGPGGGGREALGYSYVVLGRAGLRSAPAVINPDDALRVLPEPGRELDWAQPVGDVNGDDLDDIAVNSHLVEDLNVVDRRAYIVLGTPAPTDVDLQSPGDAAIAVPDATVYGGVGDVDRDGHDDIAVRTGDQDRVLYGSPTGPEGAFTLKLENKWSDLLTVTAGGDVNGDGLDDVFMSIPPTNDLATGLVRPGGVAVIFGGDMRGETIDLDQLGSRGFRVRGLEDVVLFGVRDMSAIGDVNADGFDDVAYESSVLYSSNPAEVTVLLGAPSSDDLQADALGPRAFRLTRARPRLDDMNLDIAGAGDLNADGLPDVLIGAGGTVTTDVLEQRREAYVVFGGSTADLDLGALGGPGDSPRGYAMSGVPGDRAGDRVAVPGDMDGDGQAELAVVAYRCSGVRQIETYPDISYLPQIYLPDANARSHMRGRSTHEADTLAVTSDDGLLRGRGGPDSLTGDDAVNCLFGDYGADVVTAAGAADVLVAGPGRDTLAGGEGGDLLQAGASRDELAGGTGGDGLFGGGGDDELDGGGGDDYLSGGAGKDRLHGDEGDDRLDGERGADVLRSGGAARWLSGGGGPDAIHDSGGTTKVFGGRGDDDIDVADGEKDTVYCNAGRDSVRADRVDEIFDGSGRRPDGGCENVVRVDPSA